MEQAAVFRTVCGREYAPGCLSTRQEAQGREMRATWTVEATEILLVDKAFRAPRYVGGHG